MSAPSRRVNAAGAVGGLTAIIMWLLSLKGVVAPPGIEAAITAVLSYATALIVPNALPVLDDEVIDIADDR